MTRRIEFTVADEIAEKYDEARGHEPLASWIKRALESALRTPSVDVTETPPASSRTPVESGDFGGHAAAARARQAKLNADKAGKR